MNRLERVPDPDEAARRHFPDQSMGSTTRVRHEQGRWVVYLGACFWEPSEENPVQWVWHRISDHPSQSRAEIAARYIYRASSRQLSQPPTGF